MRLLGGYELTFSARWRETFGRVEPARTAQEVEFLGRVLPLPEFGRVLDVPCGFGRHMRALTDEGYAPVGVDADQAVVEEARAAGVDARVGDMRDLHELGEFDAVVCMWASFGYFSPQENRRVLRGFAERLRPGGRLVLDLYDPAFFEPRQGTIDNRGVRDTKKIRDGRLYGELDYGDGTRDVYSWELFALDDLTALARASGLELVLACADFDESQPPRGEAPRMQLVFERATG